MIGWFGSSFFSSAKPDCGSVRRNNRPPSASLIKSIWILSRSTMNSVFTKTVGLQHAVQILKRRGAELIKRFLACALEVAFIELHHTRRRTGNSHGHSSEDFVITLHLACLI